MGKPLPNGGNSATAAPLMGDQANCVITTTDTGGTAFTAAGQITPAFCIWGAFNVVLYPQITTNITTQTASVNATVASGTGLSAGQNFTSTAIPGGTATIASMLTANVGTTTTVQIGGLSTAQVGTLTAMTASATFTGGLDNASATIQLERSFDGGLTWIVCNIGGAGTPASYQFGGSGGLTAPVSFVVAEPEKGVAYRLNCTAYSSGSIAFRISTTGMAALPWGIQVG